MKVSLLNHRKTCNKKNVGEFAVEVLETIEEEGANHKLEDPFIKDKSILYESDKSYLESKRILMHLKEESDAFRGNGILHSIILIGVFVMIMILAIISAWFYFFKIEEIALRNTTKMEKCVEKNQEYMKYSFYLQAFLFFMMAWTVVGGFLSLFVQTCCLKRRLYKMFGCGLLILYVVVFVFIVALISIQQLLVSDMINNREEMMIDENGSMIRCKWTTVANKLSLILLVLSLVVVGLTYCYVVLFTFFFRVRMKRHVRSPFDFFFCDDVCGIHKIVYRKPRVITEEQDRFTNVNNG